MAQLSWGARWSRTPVTPSAVVTGSHTAARRPTGRPRAGSISPDHSFTGAPAALARTAGNAARGCRFLDGHGLWVGHPIGDSHVRCPERDIGYALRHFRR